MTSIDGRQFGHVDLLGFVVAVVGVLVDAAAFLAVVEKGWRLCRLEEEGGPYNPIT